MANKSIQIIVIFLLMHLQLFAGTGVFQFLDLPVSSRMAALGGKNISLMDDDINFALLNPALLSPNSHNMIGLNMANYLADVTFGTAAYSRTYDSHHLAVGVQFVDYGKFKEVTEHNEILGEFSAKDVAISLIYNRKIIDNLYVGGTFKPIFSAYERYFSFGAAIDLGMSYQHPNKLFQTGLVLRNMGTQFKGYYADVDGQHYEPLPFDMQVGLSYKLRHAPFRLSATMYNLHNWNLSYIDNRHAIQSYDREELAIKIPFVDNFFRHMIIGVEFLPSKNFYVAASYNHRRHQELKMQGFKSMTGFSFGAGVKVKYFQIGFGMSQFQTGNSAYMFSLSTSLNDFRH